jgi:hypothetical protein
LKIRDRMKRASTLGWLAAASVLVLSCRDPVQPSLPPDSPFNHPCAASASIDAARLRGTVRPLLNARSSGIPPQAVSNYAGSWSGQFHITCCFRTCGLGPDVCKEYLAAGGETFSLRTTLTQDGVAIGGTLDFFDNTGTVVVESGPVSGVIDESNALVLSGTTFTTDPSEPSQSTLTGWSTVLTGGGASMSGRFTKNENFTNFWGPQHFKIDCELTNFQRVKP